MNLSCGQGKKPKEKHSLWSLSQGTLNWLSSAGVHIRFFSTKSELKYRWQKKAEDGRRAFCCSSVSLWSIKLGFFLILFLILAWIPSKPWIKKRKNNNESPPLPSPNPILLQREFLNSKYRVNLQFPTSRLNLDYSHQREHLMKSTCLRIQQKIEMPESITYV